MLEEMLDELLDAFDQGLMSLSLKSIFTCQISMKTITMSSTNITKVSKAASNLNDFKYILL